MRIKSFLTAIFMTASLIVASSLPVRSQNTSNPGVCAGGATITGANTPGATFNTACLPVVVNGSVPGQVVITNPTATITIRPEDLVPGQTFNLVIPVTNESDRPVNLTASIAGTGIGAQVLNSVTLPTASNVAPGATADMTFAFAVPTVIPPTALGQTFTVTLNIQAVGVFNPGTR